MVMFADTYLISGKNAVALRNAAIAWVVGSRVPAVGSKDSAFKLLDRRLQKAAIQFAKGKV